MNSRSLYIHWPFCLSKCPYCDFNSHVRENIDQARWRDGLLTEMKGWDDWLEPLPVDSIFFGGGTPSLMPPETIHAVVNLAKDLWGLTENCEISLEANPTSVEAGNFIRLADAGVNRVSLGIQALDDRALGFLGRAHSVREALQALEIAQTSFDRVSFDLIYGREGQTAAAWEAELREALSFGTGHLSLYQLTIEPNTGFAGRVSRGEIVMPSEDQQAEFFLVTEAITSDAGLRSYEISNFAREQQQCRHNLNYWASGSWIGIGPGAHARIDRREGRFALENPKRPETWLDQAEARQLPASNGPALPSREIAREMVMMGLRLDEGIDLADLEERSGMERDDIFQLARIRHLQSEGLIAIDQERLCVAGPGRLLLDGILGSVLK